MSARPNPDEQLRRNALITDAEFVHLDATELVDELLERIQALLGVDTVALLVLDAAGEQLVAYAARGLEEEVRQGIRVRLGAGFAGRIAVQRAPVILDQVGPSSVVNPILISKGIQSMLGVPLIAGGALVGVMHAGSLTRRRFTDHDTALLQLAADRIAAALVVEQTNAERSAARVLQRSLLPTRLPTVRGLEFAARFVPAGDFGVGGDWYDAFVLPSGYIGIVMGDVAGHGLRAAVVMGRLRSVLRAYAFVTTSPGATLDQVDRKFTHFEPREMATILYATIDPSLDNLVVASAGHPPPVFAAPGAPASYVEIETGPPIGAHIDAVRRDVVVDLSPGMTFACYTDGLVERRNESITHGLERLRSAFAAGPVESVANTVMGHMIGARVAEDDTALLTVRRV